jgi:hypothetical protein
MSEKNNISALIQAVAAKRVIYTPHALTQMSKPDRLIRPYEIRSVLNGGEIIEDYPEDSRGHSCLMLGFGNDKRPIHVVCSPKDEYLAIITAYLPDPQQWTADFKKRRIS